LSAACSLITASSSGESKPTSSIRNAIFRFFEIHPSCLAFPLWWFGLPGILKGWADRVFAMGRTYGGERFYENGVFKGKRALLSLTTGGPEVVYQKGGWNGDIHAILRPIQRGILRFTGWDVLSPNIVYAPVRVTDEKRQADLNAWALRLRSIESEKPIDVGQY
jgi:NAD(P)H dehydrogenase (quinone)